MEDIVFKYLLQLCYAIIMFIYFTLILTYTLRSCVDTFLLIIQLGKEKNVTCSKKSIVDFQDLKKKKIDLSQYKSVQLTFHALPQQELVGFVKTICLI